MLLHTLPSLAVREYLAGTSTVVRYKLDTYEGSSGSPLLYAYSRYINDITEVGVVVMAVHQRGFPRYNEGSVLTQTFLKGLRDALYD